MSDLPAKENIELALYRFDVEIIADVIKQLQKDILLSGGSFDIPESSVNDIMLLKNLVTEYISDISVTNAPLLFNLFYRVDIPQQIIAQHPVEMADLLLKRELLKVLTRRFYGK